ncbi:MAG TPA: hypothetical protein VGQ76_14550 [Thermoanaerobaculia bacterium]|jgi:hypothetical protein|nr:hypothetical protein [Thermoanaerobaculia bacterium]
MSNFRSLIVNAWRSTRLRWTNYTLGAALYFVFASAAFIALATEDRPFWIVLRSGVLANTAAICLFAVAVFLDEIRLTPARMRETVAQGGLGFVLHVRSADVLHRATKVLEGALTGYLAMRDSGDPAAERSSRQRLRDDFDSFAAIARNGTTLHGSWRRRRRARHIARQFADNYGSVPDQLLSELKTFAADY